jgi:hypothetical protein
VRKKVNNAIRMGTRRAVADMKWVMSGRGDDELWLEAVKGDADAFGLLFERHARSVYNYCFRRTGEWARAQDLTSVVFLECWRRRDTTLERGKVASLAPRYRNERLPDGATIPRPPPSSSWAPPSTRARVRVHR